MTKPSAAQTLESLPPIQAARSEGQIPRGAAGLPVPPFPPAANSSHLQEPAQHPWGQSPQPCTRSYVGIKLYMKSKSEFEISEEEMQISMGTAEIPAIVTGS